MSMQISIQEVDEFVIINMSESVCEKYISYMCYVCTSIIKASFSTIISSRYICTLYILRKYINSCLKSSYHCWNPVLPLTFFLQSILLGVWPLSRQNKWVYNMANNVFILFFFFNWQLVILM